MSESPYKMTGAQANWLRNNKPYRPLNQTPSGAHWVKRGMLHEDGTFEPYLAGKRPTVEQGSFEVAILQMKDDGR